MVKLLLESRRVTPKGFIQQMGMAWLTALRQFEDLAEGLNTSKSSVSDMSISPPMSSHAKDDSKCEEEFTQNDPEPNKRKFTFIKESFGFRHKKGRVHMLKPGGQAETIGLIIGSQIVKVNGTDVTPKEVKVALKAAKETIPSTITVRLPAVSNKKKYQNHTIGDTVRITGLTKSPQYNGRLCEIVGVTGDRFSVRLIGESKRTAVLKARNFEAVDSSEQKVFKILAKGQDVIVAKEFTSDCSLEYTLPMGLKGTIKRIDSDGDACIIFDGFKKHPWVYKANFDKLQVVNLLKVADLLPPSAHSIMPLIRSGPGLNNNDAGRHGSMAVNVGGDVMDDFGAQIDMPDDMSSAQIKRAVLTNRWLSSRKPDSLPNVPKGLPDHLTHL